MEAFLQLPLVQRVAFWNSLTRGQDPVQHWYELWSNQLLAYEGAPSGKDLFEIEFETIQLILEDENRTIPGLKSLHDARKALFLWNNNDVGFSEEDQMLELFRRVYDEDVWIPNKFTRSSNSIYHCLFNNCPYEENTMMLPNLESARKIHLAKDSSTGNTYFGLKSLNEEIIKWNYTLPTFDDLSAFTIRAIVRFKNQNAATFGPNPGGTIDTEGIWLLAKDGDNKIKFTVHDGIDLKTIESNSTHNNEIVEIYAIIDGTTLTMYIDGVLQTDTLELQQIPDYFADGKIVIGDDYLEGVNNFKGTLFEIAIDAEVITP